MLRQETKRLSVNILEKIKKGVRGFLYKDYRLSIEDELKIKSYLKQKYKKKMMSSMKALSPAK